MVASPARYPVPAAVFRFTEEIRRSRFITSLAPAATVAEAQAHIAALRQEFPDATHHCWAYLVGPPGSSAQVGMSDDGEPHGTAGRPMLNVLSHADLGDVAAVVTRFYGGTKLGKGGLVRAYSNGVQQALAGVARVERVTWCRGSLTLAYPFVTAFQRLAEMQGVRILDETYTASARFHLAVPADTLDDFKHEVATLTNGDACFEPE